MEQSLTLLVVCVATSGHLNLKVSEAPSTLCLDGGKSTYRWKHALACCHYFAKVFDTVPDCRYVACVGANGSVANAWLGSKARPSGDFARCLLEQIIS